MEAPPEGHVHFLQATTNGQNGQASLNRGADQRQRDRVTISTPSLGALVNTVQLSTEIPPWTFGTRALFNNLTRRGLLTPATQA